MQVMYIVSKIGYEYNDEVYHRPECEASEAIILYKDKAKAQAKVDEFNLEELRETSLVMYGYGEEEIFKDVELAKTLTGVKDFDYGGWEVPEWQLNLLEKDSETIDKFMKNLRIKFYEVKEVEVGDEV